MFLQKCNRNHNVPDIHSFKARIKVCKFRLIKAYLQLLFVVVMTIVVLTQVFNETEESLFIFKVYMLFNVFSVALCLFGDIVAEDLESN